MIQQRLQTSTGKLKTEANECTLDRECRADEGWGDRIGMLEDGCIRIVSKNLGGLMLDPGNDKENDLKEWMHKNEVSLVGVQETNVNWSKMRDRERFSERMRSHLWEHVRTCTAHNKFEQET